MCADESCAGNREGGEAMSGVFDEFDGNLTADVLSFNPDAIPEPDTLYIHMTRGERRVADELRKSFGGFERVVIDVDGEQHEFPADILIGLLEGYEDVHRVNRHMALFGTPERAARTLVDSCNDDYDYGCGGCPVARVNCKCGDYDALLGWLRKEGETE